jgi:hypothetical protein
MFLPFTQGAPRHAGVPERACYRALVRCSSRLPLRQELHTDAKYPTANMIVTTLIAVVSFVIVHTQLPEGAMRSQSTNDQETCAWDKDFIKTRRQGMSDFLLLE